MVYHRIVEIAPFAMLLLAMLSSVILGIWIRFLLRIGMRTAVLLALAINTTTMFWLVAVQSPVLAVEYRRAGAHTQGVTLIAIYVTSCLAIALLVKLYLAAVLNKTTPQESSPGAQGVRAWLSPLNIITVAVLAIGAGVGFDYSFISVSIVGLCALLIYPLINTLLQQTPSTATAPQAPAEERQRVLALVEAGKISADDGTQLMNALAQSQAAGTDPSNPISGWRRVMMLGAATVLVGFFLPWFTLNVTQAMNDAMSSLQQNMPHFAGQQPLSDGFIQPPAPSGNSIQAPVRNVQQFTVHGGDVRDGLGWIILAGALCAAGLPFFWISRQDNAQQHRGVIIAALAVGSIGLLYLLSSSFNAITSIEPGFLLAIAGYVMLWVGGIRKYDLRRPLGFVAG